MSTPPTSRLFYERHLPHYQPLDADYHVTFRLAGSLPASVLEELKKERRLKDDHLRRYTAPSVLHDALKESQRRFFEKYDSLLHEAATGPWWLKNEEVAAIVSEALHYRNGRVFNLLAFTLMPNHVHLAIHLGQPLYSARIEPPLHFILQSLKRKTARDANRVLRRSGAFWEEESYDHVIRDSQELERTIWYILMNPVHAALVQSWRDWQWSWVKDELNHTLE